MRMMQDLPPVGIGPPICCTMDHQRCNWINVPQHSSYSNARFSSLLLDRNCYLTRLGYLYLQGLQLWNDKALHSSIQQVFGLQNVRISLRLAFHDLRPARYRLDDTINRVEMMTNNVLSYSIGSFLGLATGHDYEEQEATSLESSPTIQISHDCGHSMNLCILQTDQRVRV